MASTVGVKGLMIDDVCDRRRLWSTKSPTVWMWSSVTVSVFTTKHSKTQDRLSLCLSVRTSYLIRSERFVQRQWRQWEHQIHVLSVTVLSLWHTSLLHCAAEYTRLPASLHQLKVSERVQRKVTQSVASKFRKTATKNAGPQCTTYRPSGPNKMTPLYVWMVLNSGIFNDKKQVKQVAICKK